MATETITKDQYGSFKSLLYLMFPLMGVFLALSLTDTFPKWVLKDELPAFIMAAGFISVLQIPLKRSIVMIQIMVAKACGAKREGEIGPIIWQGIWVGVLSMVITLPASLIAERLYFDTDSLASARRFCHFLSFFNFLFCVNGALSAFFIGRGKNVALSYLKMSSNLLFILIGLYLNRIFPFEKLQGWANALLVTESFLSLVLFFLFLRSDKKYCVRKWAFDPKLIFQALKLILPRCLAIASILLAFPICAKRLYFLEGQYVSVLVFGATLASSVIFLTNSFGEATMTLFATLMGGKNREGIRLAFSSAIKMSFAVLFLLAVILLPLTSFLSQVLVGKVGSEYYLTNLWIVLSVFGNMLLLAAFAYLSCRKQVLFCSLVDIISTWILFVIPMLIGFQKGHDILPSNFWLLSLLQRSSIALIYYWKVKKIPSIEQEGILENYLEE